MFLGQPGTWQDAKKCKTPKLLQDMANISLVNIQGAARKVIQLINKLTGKTQTQPRLDPNDLMKKSFAISIFGVWINCLLDIAELSQP